MFLHGVETISLSKGPKPITVVASSIICIIGVAPKGPVNIPTLVLSDSDAAQFGTRIPGFGIPEALDSIRTQGAGTILVVNVFDSVNNTVDVSDENVAVQNGKFKLAFAPLASLVLTNSGGTVTFIKGTDYSIDDFGNGVVLNSTTIPDGTIKADYEKLDLSTVSDNQIIGTVNVTTDARSGLKCLDNIQTDFGFKPKIIVCPGFSQKPGVSAAMLVSAAKFRAIALLDAPEGIIVSAAITGRGPSGTFGWNTSSSRASLLYPKMYKSNPDPRAESGSKILEWYSSIMAGVIANTDNTEGYWVSPSNKEIKGVVGAEKTITCSFTDSTAQNQLLNAAGIVTYFNSFGTGTRTWGNRTAMYPTDTDPKNFISIQRVVDILEDSIEQALLSYVDSPINNAVIDSIKERANSFIRILISRGALIDGSCTFQNAENSSSQIAAGNIVFTLTSMGPIPLEKITIKHFVDINLLSNLSTQ